MIRSTGEEGLLSALPLMRPSSSVSALQADTHAVEAEFGALYSQVQALEGLF